MFDFFEIQFIDWNAAGTQGEFEGAPLVEAPPLPAPGQAQNEAPDSAPFLALLNQSSYNYDSFPEVFQGNDQGSGDGGLDLDFFNAVSDAITPSYGSGHPNSTVVNALQTAGVSYIITPRLRTC
jgi:hypothetical protein